jgi:sporulation protein YlmC with PRC-barrel domain
MRKFEAMRTKEILILAAVLLSGSVYAADVEVKTEVKTDKPKVEAEIKTDADRNRADYKQEVRVESAVKAVNKARSILGMEVRNRSDEKLGEVKDLVLDMNTGKISYAALAIGGFLGVGEKLIAVPTTALTPSDHQNILIMDATRGELVDAPGFAATNWPDPRNANFGEAPFFRPKNSGNAAAAETGTRSKIYTDADGKREVRVDANTDRNEARVKANVDRDNTSPIALTSLGRVKSVQGKSVVIETSSGQTVDYINGDRANSMDLKVGDRVTVKYHRDDTKMVIDDLTRQ